MLLPFLLKSRNVNFIITEIELKIQGEESRSLIIIVSLQKSSEVVVFHIFLRPLLNFLLLIASRGQPTSSKFHMSIVVWRNGTYLEFLPDRLYGFMSLICQVFRLNRSDRFISLGLCFPRRLQEKLLI